MPSIKLKSRVSKDGTLTVKVPPPMRDREVDILITSSEENPSESKSLEELGWPPGFFEETAGSIPDLERLPQGKPESREPLE